MGQKKAFFNPVDTKVDFPSLEKELLSDWYKNGVAKKYLEKNIKRRSYFSFLDGPITANNPMGVHHGWGRTYKDIWQRFKNMQGMRQRFQNGFDAQGLWVEVEVEKELGLKSKKDIENLVEGDKGKSIAKFVDLCKKRVYKYAEIMTEQSKRLGYFMDWDNSYFTLSDENNYMIWHFLKRCHEMGLIYKGRDSVPWCPRCGTAISQHEMLTEDYKEITHEALFVAYPLKGAKDTYLLVWTTTPWTLPGNVAVAVNPKLTYALAEDIKTNKNYYLLYQKANDLGLKVHKKIKGEELIGLSYESPFDSLPRIKKTMKSVRHLTVRADERILTVSEEEGTGLVHIAPGAGSEDFALAKKLDLPVIELIDEEGVYIEGFGALTGKNAKEKPEIIFDFLKEKDSNHLFKKENYKHRYPACWRCRTELVWRVVDEWYIAMDKEIEGESLRQKMIRVAKQITWIPEFGLKRELDWLTNMHDWLISKKRYWGLALPIWVCTKCHHFEVIGGKEELSQRAVEGMDKLKGKSPHKPFIDEVKIACSNCGSLAERIPDVGNPWLDAGIVPFSTVTKNNKGRPLYTKDRKSWERWFPADFITESFPGQFKNWFYALIAMSTVLEEEAPFKTVLGFATLLAEDGRAMHKSWGNAIEFNEGADKIGVDVMRYMYASQNPKENLLFGYKVADEVRRRFHLKVWNVYNFFVTYAETEEFVPAKKLVQPKGTNILDRWILERLDETKAKVTDSLEAYNSHLATVEFENFVNDFSNWYVRRSRERLSSLNKEAADKKACFNTLYFVLVELSKLLAPFTPFMADSIYTNLTKEKSVHLTDWPKVSARKGTKLLESMEGVRLIAERVHAIRKEKGIPVRQPLAKLTSEVPFSIPMSLRKIFLDEVNIKKWVVRKGDEIKNDLDFEITEELKEEADARELVRKIQKKRKEMKIDLKTEILVTSPWLPQKKEFLEYIVTKTLAKELKKGAFKVEKKLK